MKGECDEPATAAGLPSITQRVHQCYINMFIVYKM